MRACALLDNVCFRRGLAAARLSVLLLPCALAACSPRGPGEGEALRVVTWASAWELRLEQRIVDEYRQRHPGVRVALESVPQSGYRETVLTSMAAGEPPSVFLVDNASNAFLQHALLLELGRYGFRVGVDPAAYYGNVVEVFRTADGGLYAFPKDFTPMVIYYNRRLFDEAGVPPPREDWTWDDFLAAAKALTRDADGDGEADRFGAPFLRDLYLWQPWVWAAGGDILDPGGLRATGHLDSAATRRALRFLLDLAVEHGVVPTFELKRWGINDQRMFFSGRLAMIESGHWFLVEALRHMRAGRIELGVAPLPRAPGGEPVTVIYAAGWVVPRAARHRRRAVELAAWLAGPYAQRVRAEAGLAVPALRAVAQEMVRADTLGLEAQFQRVIPYGRAPWGTRVERFLELEDLLPTMLDRVLVEGTSLDSVTAAMARRLDGVLAR